MTRTPRGGGGGGGGGGGDGRRTRSNTWAAPSSLFQSLDDYDVENDDDVDDVDVDVEDDADGMSESEVELAQLSQTRNVRMRSFSLFTEGDAIQSNREVKWVDQERFARLLAEGIF